VKEAGLQRLVLTLRLGSGQANRKYIRGYMKRMSKHTIAKSKEYKSSCGRCNRHQSKEYALIVRQAHCDAGGDPNPDARRERKSAEVVVLTETSRQ
jgi:hypothetical protein